MENGYVKSYSCFISLSFSESTIKPQNVPVSYQMISINVKMSVKMGSEKKLRAVKSQRILLAWTCTNPDTMLILDNKL